MATKTLKTTLDIEIEVLDGDDAVKEFRARLAGGMPEQQAAATQLIRRVSSKTSPDLVDTVPLRMALCRDSDFRQKLKDAAGVPQPEKKGEEKKPPAAAKP